MIVLLFDLERCTHEKKREKILGLKNFHFKKFILDRIYFLNLLFIILTHAEFEFYS